MKMRTMSYEDAIRVTEDGGRRITGVELKAQCARTEAFRSAREFCRFFGVPCGADGVPAVSDDGMFWAVYCSDYRLDLNRLCELIRLAK